MQFWCDLTLSVMGGQFEKATGKLKAVMPALVPAVEALMRAPDADETTIAQAGPPVTLLGLSVLSRPVKVCNSGNSRTVRVANQ